MTIRYCDACERSQFHTTSGCAVCQQKDTGPIMMIPTVHLNGTGKTSLLEELQTARLKLQEAIDALHQVTVHGRDYYVQGPHAYTQAREEMNRRLQALEDVHSDVLELALGIQKQEVIMTFTADDLLGKDFIFNRADRVGTVRSKITVIGYDPDKGWQLAWLARQEAWVPDAQFRQLFSEGVLE